MKYINKTRTHTHTHYYIEYTLFFHIYITLSKMGCEPQLTLT